MILYEMYLETLEMNKKINHLVLLAAVMLLFAACAKQDTPDKVMQYPQTDKVETVFQTSMVPDSCRVFAHLFVTMPAKYTGQEFVEAVSGEARSKGADMMLIGQSRQCTTETEIDFTYYGPDREYKIREWPGWNFGFEEWEEQGEWASIGYKEWGNSNVRYDFPVVMQVIFLRCQ